MTGRPRSPKIYAGATLNLWTLIEELPRIDGQSVWLCECACGTRRAVRQCHLATGRTRSCGCVKLGKRTHGHARRENGKKYSPEYQTWMSIKRRCRKGSSDFPLYGGRGIKVCERWTNDFSAFLEDMGPKPSPLHSIERDNSDGDYEPENCRWATPKEQANNTSRNHYVTVRGERMTLQQAVDRYGGNYGTVKWRVYQGQSIEEALGL